jgi:hypothetical protein
MPEYTSNAVQTVAVGQNVAFTETAVRCTKGYVNHREGAGIITLRGVVNNPSACFARYQISFGGNIAIPATGTVGEISLAISVGGEALGPATMAATPAAVSEFWNVHSSIFVDVPKGCCVNVAVQNTSTQPIDVRNANIIVERTA